MGKLGRWQQPQDDLGTQPNGVYFYQLKQEQKIIKMGKLVIRH
ncbi:MAG: hypothetical protein U0Z17_08280 [Bacteroidales bacterium]